jgi:hypothetical protein
MIFLPTSSNIFISKDKKELKVQVRCRKHAKKLFMICLVKKIFEKVAINSTEYSVAISNLKKSIRNSESVSS